MAKVIKSGYLVPPLIVNFKWKEGHVKKQQIRFYPFIRKNNLKKYTANIKSIGRSYKMFNYNLSNLKYDVLFSK